MEIIKSIRKTISLKVDNNGKIIIKAPFFITKKTINTFVEKNRDWIDKRIKEINEGKKEFREGEYFFLFGEKYKIIFDDKSNKIYFDKKNLYINKIYKDCIKEKLIDFYKKEAREYIKKRADFIALKYGLKFNNLKITSATTRWGSCTSKKNINFSYRLVMAPIEVIDYVIIHELAHLKEMNHSKNFWGLVEEMSKNIGLEDYKKYKKYLRDNGSKLMY